MPKENFEDEEKIEAHAEALIEVAQRNEGQSVMVFMVADGAVKQNAGMIRVNLIYNKNVKI